MLEFKVKKTEHNHYIKKTILENWLIDNKYYCFDVKENNLLELGKGQSNTQFTSLLISKKVEDYIRTNEIENKFENSVKVFIKHDSFINPKGISKIPADRLSEIEDEKVSAIFKTCVDYIALQVTRNPNNTYKYFSNFREYVESQSIIFSYHTRESQCLMLSMKYKEIFDEEPEAYPTLFNMNREKINQPNEFHFIRSKNNIFCLAENNTCSLFELLDNAVLCQEMNCDSFKNIYITVLSPSLLFLLNCSEDLITDKDMELLANNIEYLWISFISSNSLGKIIMPSINDIIIENIKLIFSEKGKNINNQAIYNNFSLSESVYKRYLL